MADKKEAPADPIADNRAAYDHKEGVYTEPKVGDEPKVVRHQVDARQDIDMEEEGNGPIPRRADPFAAQRDEKAAKAEYAKEKKEGEKASDK